MSMRIDTIHKRKRKEKGFSLIETMITMSLFLVILGGVYALIIQFGDVTRTQNARTKLQQESRFMMSSFADELKDVGSVLSLGAGLTMSSGAAGKMPAVTPTFYGLYPLNNSYGPDGIIIASGDPDAKTNLRAPFSVGSGTLDVESATVPGYDSANPYEIRDWNRGDKVIILGDGTYYIGSVTGTNAAAKTISLRDSAVYYAGLLNSSGSMSGAYYYDSASKKGNSYLYPKGCPVVRLSNFSIYLFKEIDGPLTNRKIRQMIRVTDTKGEANVLTDGSQAEMSIISENIWDMQISYIAYPNFSASDRNTAIDPAHHYFASSSSPSTMYNLMNDIQNRILRQIDIGIVAITDEYSGTGKVIHHIPNIGDRSAYDMPEGKYGCKILSVSVQPRNFNIYSSR